MNERANKKMKQKGADLLLSFYIQRKYYYLKKIRINQHVYTDQFPRLCDVNNPWAQNIRESTKLLYIILCHKHFLKKY
jgi:hypothetical protein